MPDERDNGGSGGSTARSGLSALTQEQKVERAALRVLATTAVRASLQARMGKSYKGDRDLFAAFGYDKNPEFDDYLQRYYRNEVARSIVDRPVKACWRAPHPVVTEQDEDQTEFEKAWVELADRLRVFHMFSRVDRLGSIGRYAVLLLGFDDAAELDQPVTRASSLLYLQPYSQASAEIKEYEQDTKNERYGRPVIYEITMKKPGTTSLSRAVRVHHTRVIHVLEDPLEDNVLGTPRLQAVLNRLEDLERVTGSSGEMFFRGAFPGYAFKTQEGATVQGQDADDLEDEIEEYLHNFKRYVRLTGMDIEAIAQQLADPGPHIDAILDLIACGVEMPKRIMMGSERGELASSQDERNWAGTVSSRRTDHCEPVILRPFVDLCVEVGVLPAPSEEGYTVEWSDLMAPSLKEKADVGKTRAEATKLYVDSGSSNVVPEEVFLESIGYTKEEIEQIELILQGERDDEEDDARVAREEEGVEDETG